MTACWVVSQFEPGFRPNMGVDRLLRRSRKRTQLPPFGNCIAPNPDLPALAIETESFDPNRAAPRFVDTSALIAADLAADAQKTL